MTIKTTFRLLTTLICISPLIGDERSDVVDANDKPCVAPSVSNNLVVQGNEAQKNEKIYLENLKGVVLVPSRSDVVKEGVQGEGFQATNMDVPGGLERLNQELGPDFIGQPLSKNKVIELKRRLILYYRDEGYPVVTVEVPEQSLGQGAVQLIVTEGKVGNVTVQGNKYFSTDSFLEIFDLKSCEVVSSDAVLGGIAWVNRNPFRHADVFFAPGQDEGTTDIEVIVKDRWPFRVYAGGDNTGINVTGEARWFTGFNWGNAFWLGHQLSYQFSMSTDYRRFWAHTVQYNAPLSWRHVLLVYGGYSRIHPDISGFKSTGHSTQASLRYQIPFKPIYNSFIEELTLGFDFKNTNNNLFFVESVSSQTSTVPVVEHGVNITQLYAGYSLGKSYKTNQLSFNIEFFWSPGKWIGDQQNKDFASLHPGAKNHYVYSRLTCGDVWKLPRGFSVIGQFRGQISTQNLIPSEQFGLGGYNTVRGYEEREVNYDDAICTNFEFYLPSFKLFGFSKKHRDEVQILGFFDYATGRNVHQEFDEPQWQHLVGVGPGLRYKITDYLSFRLDWGFKLHKTEFSHLGSKVHVGLIGSY